MDIETIVSFLLEALKDGPLTGAKLGEKLKNAFPSLRTEPGYTTLTQFVQQHASSQIGRTRTPSGGDALFHLIAEGSPPLAAGAFGASLAPSAWGAFVKTDLPYQLTVDFNTGEVHVVAQGQVVEEPQRTIAKLALEDNRQIAEDFLSHVAVEDQTAFQDALNAQSYWPAFSDLVHKTLAAKYMAAWQKHRFDAICGRFQDRVRAAGASEEVAVRALKDLQGQKEQHAAEVKRAAEVYRGASQWSSGSSYKPSYGRSTEAYGDAEQLRRVAQRVVGSLSDEDLRRLWLPLGEVLNALRQIRP